MDEERAKAIRRSIGIILMSPAVGWALTKVINYCFEIISAFSVVMMFCIGLLLCTQKY